MKHLKNAGRSFDSYKLKIGALKISCLLILILLKRLSIDQEVEFFTAAKIYPNA